MRNLIDQSGLIAGSDYLSLSRTMALHETYIFDKITGAKHLLHVKAASLIDLLRWPIPYDLWSQFAKTTNLSDQFVLDILLSLNDIGALEIYRSAAGHQQIIYKHIRSLSHGIKPLWLTRRRPANFINICLTVLLAMQPLVLGVSGLALLAYGLNLNLILILASALTFLGLLIISTILHELIHSLIIAKSHQTQVILRRGLRLGLIHPPLTAKAELKSALLGPLAGALVCWSGGLIIGQLFNKLSFFTALGSAVGAMHLISLLPSYGDGRIVWQNLKEKLA